MEWMQVAVETHPAAEDIVAALLIDLGAEGVQIESAPPPQPPVAAVDRGNDVYYASHLEQPKIGRESAWVFAYFSVRQWTRECAQNLSDALAVLRQRASIPVGSLAIDCERHAEAEWTDRWKAAFHIQRVTSRFVVVPSWETSSYQPKSGDLPLFLDPGAAFGTGTHETTAMCLALMEEAMRPGARVLDVGCGSGILSIAAARLGASQVDARDLSPLAVDVARENVVANGVEAVVTVEEGDLLEGVSGRYDWILANLVSDLILALLPSLHRVLLPHGQAVLSGIIGERMQELDAALYKHGFCIQQQRQRRDWVALCVAPAQAMKE
ncbi:MAG: 50S ribosomal protein L11 methyltransferase [Firmicutes bacterium]|nr:50S ribosomal protein L11 methyltransferase [Bacillota bacterium]